MRVCVCVWERGREMREGDIHSSVRERHTHRHAHTYKRTHSFSHEEYVGQVLEKVNRFQFTFNLFKEGQVLDKF